MSNPVIDDALDKILPRGQRGRVRLGHAGQHPGVPGHERHGPAPRGEGHIPEPWTKDGSISRAKRDLYQYYAIMMEPWDGPASILFSDGDAMGAVLDRTAAALPVLYH